MVNLDEAREQRKGTDKKRFATYAVQLRVVPQAAVQKEINITRSSNGVQMQYDHMQPEIYKRASLVSPSVHRLPGLRNVRCVIASAPNLTRHADVSASKSMLGISTY
jgi:hypothetical protein